jgi:C_GCAxxG_C_C family probable redox protein
MLRKAYDLGCFYEREYKGCCQCVIAAVQDALGLEDDADLAAVFKAGTALAGGLCSTGTSACGALSGGVMAIGSRFGRERSNFADPEKKRFKTKDMGLELYNRFMEKYGSGICRGVQQSIFGRSFDLRDPVDREAFMAAGAHGENCTSVVGNAARWTAEIILAHKDNNQAG